MLRRKPVKPKIPRLTSVEEAMEATSHYLSERSLDDPSAEGVTAEQLRSLIERIWHDAYDEGRASGYEEGRSESGE